MPAPRRNKPPASLADPAAVPPPKLDRRSPEPQPGASVTVKPVDEPVTKPKGGSDQPIRLTDPIAKPAAANKPKSNPIDDLGDLDDDFDLGESPSDKGSGPAAGRKPTVLPPRRAEKEPIGVRKNTLKTEVSKVLADDEKRAEPKEQFLESGFNVDPILPRKGKRKESREK